MLYIYICAFKNKNYLEEAEVCIKTLRTNGLFSGPIYLFTDFDIFLENVNIIKVKCENIYIAAGFRLRLFDYIKEYTQNDIFMYLDTDIVVLKPIPSFADIGNKIQVYGYNERTQIGSSFSGFITDDTKFTLKPSICSGILLFRPSVMAKKVFDETYELYTTLVKNKKINDCWEQPALCFKLIEHDMYDVSLNDYVYEERTRTPITESHIFNHFCGLRSSMRHRSMTKYLYN